MNFFKIISAGLLFLYSFSVLAQQHYIAPSVVTIPAGTFIMGSDAGGGLKLFHSPAHKVSVKTFQLSQYEVTVKEFRAFVVVTKHKTRAECWKRKAGTHEIEMVAGSWDLPAYAPSEFHPVMCIGLDDALAYSAWLSQKTGHHYRLPTEAEWEYAARAGSNDNYFFGNDEKQLCEYANVLDKTGARAFERDLGVAWTGVDCDDHAEYTAIIGMYKPNAFGLFDMIGNVGELVQDCQHWYYKNAPTDGSAWITDCDNQEYFFGLISEEMGVHRGGNYGLSGLGSRVFERGHTGKNNSSSLGEGFRLALDIVDSAAAVPVEQLESTQDFLTELKLIQKNSLKRPSR